VLKVDGAWGGTGVRLAATPEQAYAAFHRLRRRMGVWVALKRMLVNHDPFCMADQLRRGHPEVSVQAYVRGHPGNLTMFCWNGDVLAATVAETVACSGRIGPSTIVRLVDRPEVVASAGRLARELRLTGFHGLDFMVEEATGRALLIELNPRPTSLSNIRLEPGRDLVRAAAIALLGVACPPPPMSPTGDLVAHFPLAWQWDRDDTRLETAFQDVPWDEPALMAEMLRPSWPERLWLARVASSLLRLLRRWQSDRARQRSSALDSPHATARTAALLSSQQWP